VTTETTLREPPRVSGGGGENGHLDELSRDPIGLMARVRAECGDVGEFTLAERDVVLLTGADANEFYFRAPEEQLDQAEAYPFMTPPSRARWSRWWPAGTTRVRSTCWSGSPS